jgi:hypothetical protein
MYNASQITTPPSSDEGGEDKLCGYSSIAGHEILLRGFTDEQILLKARRLFNAIKQYQHTEIYTLDLKLGDPRQGDIYIKLFENAPNCQLLKIIITVYRLSHEGYLWRDVYDETSEFRQVISYEKNCQLHDTFLQAAKYGDLQRCKSLLEQGVSIFAQTKNGEFGYALAAINGYYHVVRFFAEEIEKEEKKFVKLLTEKSDTYRFRENMPQMHLKIVNDILNNPIKNLRITLTELVNNFNSIQKKIKTDNIKFLILTKGTEILTDSHSFAIANLIKQDYLIAVSLDNSTYHQISTGGLTALQDAISISPILYLDLGKCGYGKKDKNEADFRQEIMMRHLLDSLNKNNIDEYVDKIVQALPEFIHEKKRCD